MSYRRPPILQHTPFDFDASELLDEFVERCQRLLFFFKARRPSRLPLPLFLIGPGRRRCAARRGPRCVLRCRHRTWPGQGGRVARLPHQPSRVRVVRHTRNNNSVVFWVRHGTVNVAIRAGRARVWQGSARARLKTPFPTAITLHRRARLLVHGARRTRSPLGRASARWGPPGRSLASNVVVGGGDVVI